jgi:hypothetical protein
MGVRHIFCRYLIHTKIKEVRTTAMNKPKYTFAMGFEEWLVGSIDG